MLTKRRITKLTVRLSTPIPAAILMALLLAFAGCQSDAEKIRATNEATRSPISAEIDWTEIQDGDCINSTLPKGIDIESVVIVPCSGPWQYRVVNSFETPGPNLYPGKDFFRERAYQSCDPRYTLVLFPNENSWDQDPKEINCLQESFGLSVTDPAKLDRLVDLSSILPGDCFNEAPETGDLLVEAVDCSGDWELQVVNIISVSENQEYPGDDYFKRQAEQGCESPWDFYYPPNSETWEWGGRSITCVRTFAPAPTSAATPALVGAKAATPLAGWAESADSWPLRIAPDTVTVN